MRDDDCIALSVVRAEMENAGILSRPKQHARSAGGEVF
jgi:hypothetical protein